MAEFVINNTRIAKNGTDCYFIADIGTNYIEIGDILNISYMDAAKLIIDQATESATEKFKINAIKFQIYKADELVSKKYSPKDYEFIKQHDKLGTKEYLELFSYCRGKGFDVMATLFSPREILHYYPYLDAIKIASPDITYYDLIKTALSVAKKPVIISTGASNALEVYNSISHCSRSISGDDLAILYCNSIYPCPTEEANLGNITFFKETIPNRIIGYSDHSLDETIIKMAYIIGARIIEKHFTAHKKYEIYNKYTEENDHLHSFISHKLNGLFQRMEKIKKMIGNTRGLMSEKETDVRNGGRRSIFAKEDIKEGEIITEDKITFLRPGIGISPINKDFIIGMKSKRDINKGDCIDIKRS